MVVLDVGTGTGALAQYSLIGDALYVHAVEASEMIFTAKANPDFEKWKSKITFY